MSNDHRQIQLQINPQDSRAVGAALTRLAGQVQKDLRVDFTAVSDEVANARNFTMRVVDLLGQEFEDRCLLLVHVSATDTGDPSGAGNTVAFSTGFVYATLVPGAAYLVLTDTSGKAVMQLTVAGAGTRHVAAEVLGVMARSGEYTYA